MPPEEQVLVFPTKVLEQTGDKQQAASNLRRSMNLKGLSEEDLSEAEKLLTKLMQ